MRIPFAGRLKCPLDGPFRIAFVGLLALVTRQRSTLTIRELSFFQLGQPSMTTRIKRKSRRQTKFVAHRMHDFLHPAK